MPAVERDAEQPGPGCLKALMRRLRAGTEIAEGSELGMPLQRIYRILDRWQVGLVCGHIALRPLTKGGPGLVPCFACAAGLPPDQRIVEVAIESATHAEKARYRALLGAAECRCPKRGGDRAACVYEQLVGLGLEDDDARRTARKEPCHCHCHCHRGEQGGGA